MIKKLLLGILVAAVFFASYGQVAEAIMGRGNSQGYFLGNVDASGDYVFRPHYSPGPISTGCEPDNNVRAIPMWVSAKQFFIGYILCKLNSNATFHVQREDRTGAAFVIQTMRGAYGPWACEGGAGNNCRPSDASINDWAARVNNPAVSVNWNACVSWSINSMYQGNPPGANSSPNDDAFYNSGGSACEAIVFSWPGGSYTIRRFCGNPVTWGEIPSMPLPWTGSARSTISDGFPDAGDNAYNITTRPGDTLSFNHYVQNLGPGTANLWFHISGRNGANNPWTAQYYNNTALSGAPVLTRTENNIDYRDNAGNVSPGPGVLADGFSARWTRTQAFTAGDHVFRMKVDDGGRLYVDGVLVLDAWIGQAATPYSITRNLTAGNHTITLEYFEGGGPGWTTLDYSNYYVVGGTDSGWYNSGEEKLVNSENYVVPLAATPGSQYCRRVLWDWRNNTGSGEWGLGTAGWADMVCATVSPPQDLTPTINVQVNGGAAPGNLAEPGDTITFTYAVGNGSTSVSATASCTYRQATYTGYSTTAPVTAFVPGGSNCPPDRTFPASANTVTATENTTSVANRSLCRSLTVTPAAADGSARTAQACAFIVTKPYVRAFGGDLSAGNGLTTAPGICTPSNDAAIIGWNRRAGATFGGAGTQYAAFALSTIFDAASSQAGGGATAGAGLSFRNTSVNLANGNFGGVFGSVPCIADHYATKPSTTSSLPASVGAMVTGSYSAIGNTTLAGGTINSPNRIGVYIDGDVFISSNITYGGSWVSGAIPSFRLIVRGNIFIDNDVSQLDGLYVAQATAGSGGVVYTCTTEATPFAPPTLNGTLGSLCNHAKLTVNGGVVARQVRLLRTLGSVGQAIGGAEASSSATIAEVFNYTPAMWMVQPPLSTGGAVYDSITTLPPVL